LKQLLQITEAKLRFAFTDLDGFYEFLEDKGSAANIWMSRADATKLMKLYNAGCDVKSKLIKMPKNTTPDVYKATFNLAIAKEKAAGWAMFRFEQNDNSFDVIFTKKKPLY